MTRICLDTGVIGIFLSKNPTSQVKKLRNAIAKGEIQVCLPKPVLIETFFHLCKNEGKEPAKIILHNFLERYPLELVEFDRSLITLAGELKCHHRKELSYIDAMGIALSLDQKISFHTTEKKLKSLPNNILTKLKTVTYSF